MTDTKTSPDRSKIPLNRVLGLPTAILLVAGIVIGSGVFKKITPMAQSLPDAPWIVIAWIVAGLMALCGAFSYGGLASLTKESGGTYEYLRLCFGNFFSFLFGWSVFIIAGSGSIAALAFIFSQSINTIFPIPDPLHTYSSFSLGHFIYPFASSGIKIIAVLTICILTWINYRGVRKGGTLNNIITLAKITGIAVLIVAGLIFSSPQHEGDETTNFTSNTGNAALLSGLFAAVLSALWAYDGFTNITYISGEIKNPQRNVGVAIIAGVGITILLYVLLNFAYMQVMPVSQLAVIGENKIAGAEVASLLMGNGGKIFISVLIMISTFGALNACIIVYPRLYYRMSQENFFFKKVAHVHPVFRTPYVSLIYSMVWSSVLVVTGTFDQLTNLVIFSAYAFYALAVWGVIKMKRRGLIKTKVIGYPFTPLVFIILTIVLSINTAIVQPKQSLLGVLLILSGVPLYYYFRKKNRNNL
ncbi:MAG TPA: amino acid permease [Chitinophagaceae bacterium]|nr:amino acid permease [Chitinophagaceae bacterium]